MHHDKFNPSKLKITGRRIWRPPILCLVFLLCLGAGLLSGQILNGNHYTNAVTNLGLAGASTMSIASTSSAVNLSVTPSPSGTFASSSHGLTASTNAPTGYSLSLGSTASTSGSSTLTPSSGTFATPATLADNTWGYAIAGAGGFDSSYATPTPSSSSKWANPTTTATIKTTSATATNDSTTVYYGVKANTSFPSGTYTGTVTYTASANTSSIPTPSIVSISPTSGTTAGGGTIQIVGTGLAWSITNTISPKDTASSLWSISA